MRKSTKSAVVLASLPLSRGLWRAAPKNAMQIPISRPDSRPIRGRVGPSTATCEVARFAFSRQRERRRSVKARARRWRGTSSSATAKLCTVPRRRRNSGSSMKQGMTDAAPIKSGSSVARHARSPKRARLAARRRDVLPGSLLSNAPLRAWREGQSQRQRQLLCSFQFERAESCV